jgi:uncharacterized protein (TIGR03086 family)
MTPDQSPADEDREIAGRFTQLIQAVPDEQTWARPAPVDGWTARDVVGHLVGWFPGLLQAGAGITLAVGVHVDDDPFGAWRTFSDGVQAVLDDPASEAQVFSHPQIGTLPLGTAVSRYSTADVFLHTWDLARATDQDATLDPQRCAVLLEGMQPIDDVLRASGQYGPRVPVPDDADPQTQLLGVIGRDPLA